jgi:hypothetical protein
MPVSIVAGLDPGQHLLFLSEPWRSVGVDRHDRLAAIAIRAPRGPPPD